MFLTKKSLLKIIIIAIIYFVLGSICFPLGMLLTLLGLDNTIIIVLGIFCLVAGALILVMGRYVEGKLNLENKAITLIRKELRPADFLAEYECLINSNDLVVNKPSFEMLHYVAAAYSLLDQTEKVSEIFEEMMAVVPEKKKTYALFLKAGLLYERGRTEEADKLFEETYKLKLDFSAKAQADIVINAFRAIAKGDYKLAELYYLKSLECTFPKPDNLSKLIFHYELAKLYEKMQENEKAIPHYQYCAENGGQTAMRESAKAALERLAAL